MINDVDFSSLFFLFSVLSPCIVKRGSCCLLIVKLGICIPHGDLTIQSVPMVFPLWVIFSCLGQSILSQLSRRIFSTFLYISHMQPFPWYTLLIRGFRLILPSCLAMVVQGEILIVI